LGVLALLVILGSFALLTFRSSWETVYLKESNYYTIQIETYDNTSITPDQSAKKMKALILDHLIHGYSVADTPEYLLYEYLKVFSGLAQYWLKDNPTPAVLHMGGGSYSFPRYIEATYPKSVNDVIEIDPAVTEIAYQEMGLTKESRITTFNEDARIYFSDKSVRGKYDIVTGDCFNDLSTPYHLTTVEFDRMVKASMKPGGVYLVNIIDDYYGGTYLPSILNTLKHAFTNVYVFFGWENYEAIGGSTFVIVATDRHLDLDDFKAYNSKNGKYANLIHFREEKVLEEYLAERNPILLTDDYAPTDLLVARLSRLRMERR
jgi:spermidine synthase